MRKDHHLFKNRVRRRAELLVKIWPRLSVRPSYSLNSLRTIAIFKDVTSIGA